jgi:hypothetical protein
MVHFTRTGVLKTALLAMLGAAALAPAETIDRIAVAVGNRVITVSDIERQLRLAGFLSGAKPELTAEARRRSRRRRPLTGSRSRWGTG